MQIEDGHPPANRKKKINLTEEEGKQIIAQLMIGCIWVDDLPKLNRKAILRVAIDFDKNMCTVRRYQTKLLIIWKINVYPKKEHWEATSV
jgi:hypothetical protein